MVMFFWAAATSVLPRYWMTTVFAPVDPNPLTWRVALPEESEALSRMVPFHTARTVPVGVPAGLVTVMATFEMPLLTFTVAGLGVAVMSATPLLTTRVVKVDDGLWVG